MRPLLCSPRSIETAPTIASPCHPSALLHHLESGSCRSGLTRQELNAIVQFRDIDRIITSGHLLSLETSTVGPDFSSPTESHTLFTPQSSFRNFPLPPRTGSSYSGQLTPQSDNSRQESLSPSFSTGITCPLCPANRKRFCTSQALQDHLSSLAHDQKIYHCPLTLYPARTDGPQMMKYFFTLSGLTQHIESGACKDGEDTFRKAMEMAGDKLRQLGFEEPCLLN